MTINNILEKRLSKDQICDKCSKVLKQNSVALFHKEKQVYKHKDGCPPEWIPSRTTKPKGVDLIMVIETFKPMTELMRKAGIDMLKYEEDELVKLFWLYKQYLREKDKKVPF